MGIYSYRYVIYIVGVAHRAQSVKPGEQKTEAQQYFTSRLDQIIRELKPTFVAEAGTSSRRFSRARKLSEGMLTEAGLLSLAIALGYIALLIGPALGRFGFTSGDACLKLTDHIENLPKKVQETFTEEEFKDVGRKAAGAMLHFGTLYDLTVQDTFRDELENGLVWRGLAYERLWLGPRRC